jgi:DNA-binding transcriptional MerR regulator
LSPDTIRYYERAGLLPPPARTASGYRVNGHLHLPALRAARDAHVAAQTVSATRHDEPMIAA